MERQLGVTLCPALRVLYRVHDGQELEFDRQVLTPGNAGMTCAFLCGVWVCGWVCGPTRCQPAAVLT